MPSAADSPGAAPGRATPRLPPFLALPGIPTMTASSSSSRNADSRSADDAARPLEARMEQATEALQHGRYFEAERRADETLHAARNGEDFDLVARITLPLQEARRQRRLEAAETGLVHVHRHELPALDAAAPPAGIHIVMHPFVAADARRLADAAFDAEVPVIVFAREPRTRSGRIPVVVVGPDTIRTHVPPPDHETGPESEETDDAAASPPRPPSIAWCLDVVDDALTNAALDLVDPTRPPDRRVDDLIDLLDTHPLSERLHQALAAAARAASRA